MSKKLVALLLLLCMLIVAMPVFTIAAAAEELPAPSAFMDNYPAYDITNRFASGINNGNGKPEYVVPVSFNGNWDVVTYINKNYALAKENQYLMNGSDSSFSDAFLAAGYGVGYGSYSSMRWSYSGYWGSTGSLKVCAAHPIGFRYVSPYTGTADLSYTAALANSCPDADSKNWGTAYFAVFKNGVMLWPNAGNYFTDFSKWKAVDHGATYTLNGDDLAMLTNVSVTAGDKLEFIAATSANTWNVIQTPQVAFTAVTAENAAAASTSKAAYPFYQAGAQIYHSRFVSSIGTTWYDNWTAGTQSNSNHNNWAIYSAANEAYGPRHPSGDWGWGWMYKNDDLITPKEPTAKTGFRFTAPLDGDLVFDVQKLSIVRANAHRLAIFHNDKMVWPTVNGGYSTNADWFEAYTATTYGTTTGRDMSVNLTVKAGDAVTLLVWHDGPSEEYQNQRSLNGTIIDCHYTSVSSYYHTSISASTNLPTVSGCGMGSTVTFQNGWDIISYPASGVTGDATLMNYTANRDSRVILTSTPMTTIAAAYGNYAAGSPVAAMIDTAGNWGNNKIGLYAINDNYAGYRYTIPCDGDISITVDKLGRSGAWAENADFAIYINDTKIWPADGWYTSFHHNGNGDANVTKYVSDAELASINAAIAAGGPRSVKAGDTVEFLMHGLGDTYYSSTGNVIYSSIDYETPYTGTTAFFSTTYAQIDYLNYLYGNTRLASQAAKVGDPFPGYPGITAADKYVTADGEDTTLPAKVTGATTVYVCDCGTVDAFANNTPVVSDETVTFKRNWKAVRGIWSADIATAKNPFWAFETALSKGLNGYAVAPSTTNLWASNAGGWQNRFATVGTASKVGNGAMWTAPVDGVVSIDFTQLDIGNENAGRNNPYFYFAITLNGEVIWPSDGKPFYYEHAEPLTSSQYVSIKNAAAEKEAFPIVEIKEGDQLAFIGNMGGNNWPMKIYPSITYTSLENHATISAQTTMTEAFNLKITASSADYTDIAVRAITGEGIGAEAITNGKKLTGFTSTRLTESVRYIITGQKSGKTVTLGVGQITIADYLNTLIAASEDEKTADLAYAILNYANEAETTFKDSSKIVLPTYEMQQNFKAEPKNVFGQTADDGKQYRFSGASLLLNDNVEIKLFIDRQNPAAPFDSLINALDVDVFADAVKLKVKCDGVTTYVDLVNRSGCTDGTFLKAYVEIPVANYGKTYTFAITDANGTEIYSTELTYSVESYLSAMIDGEQANLLNALWLFAQAAAAYTAA